MMLPGFNRAIIRVPIFGRVRKFKNPSGVLNTTEQPSAVACAVPVARNSAAITANHSGVRWSIDETFIVWKELVPFIIAHSATGFAVKPTLVFNVTCKLERA